MMINAQVSFGGKSAVEGSSTIIDFNSDIEGKKVTDNTVNNTNGIILPSLHGSDLTTVDSNSNGSFYFDTDDNIVKMYQNNIWVNLSDIGTGSSTVINANTSNESTAQSGVIIGAVTTNAKGVLVLESSNKAMILPRIANPHLTVKTPHPGMMYYDVVSKTLAVFDGALWHYWK